MADDIAFSLRGRPFGGGANSVVQEFATLAHAFGVGHLVVEKQHLEDFRRGYSWPGGAASRVTAELHDVPDGSAFVATTNDSLAPLVEAVRERASRVYYYVQDYEPLFYGPHTQQHATALTSYALAQEAVAVVKTAWLADTVMANTFFPVVRIRPSIDRSLYHPSARSAGGPRTLVAMLRPATPRRGAARTVALVNRVAASPSLGLRVEVFGSAAADLAAAGLALDQRVRNHGRLSSRGAAELVRTADVLLDLSDYQAFGRTVAEGMAAGAVPVVTERGAPPEFVRDGINGFLAPPADLDLVYDRVARLAALPDTELAAMRADAITAVSDWSLESAAADWLTLMRDA